jgi:Repeat of unknown function (DUF5648)
MGRNGAMHAVAFGAAMLAVAFDANAATLADCRFKGGGGDAISRGFYVSNYAGTTVDTVTIAHAAPDSERRTIRLTMRLNAYNGPILGVSEHTRTIGPEATPTIFRFDGAVVPAGARLVFTQAVTSGAANVNYDVGAGPCSNVTQTEGTTAPLDDFRRATVGLMITGSPTDITDVTTFSCPFGPNGGGDRIDRGFYVTNYPGTKIRRVVLRHSTDTPEQKWIGIEARLGSYDGPLIGSGSVIIDIGSNFTETSYLLSGGDVPAGSTIAFRQWLIGGSGLVFYDKGFGPCLDVVETAGTAPPLDEYRNDSIGMRITGDVASDAPIVAVEYYHAGFGHYFLTAQADEIAGLDGGAYGGAFARTGLEFNVRDGPADGAIPVCRFFTVTFAPKSSHFYTSDPDECEAVKNNPDWQFEKVAFYVHRDEVGACPAGTIPVYRIYNDGQSGAPNHRFTTNLALYGNFVNTQGWAAEGVRFCVPQ